MIKLQKRYKVENHFIRRRVNQLKKRVLLRKFGYLFFRKTVSNVLPSTATNFYLRILLEKAFKKLVMNWYVERIEWKHNLRAELHHNFVLKKKTFQRFAIFYVRKKTKRVKTAIADIMFEKNFKRRILKSTFDQWEHFATYKKSKKLKQAVADQYFSNNFKTEKIRPYFDKWTIFTQNRRTLKLKMQESFGYYQTKLKSRVFNAFLSYVTHRRLRKNQIERAYHFYSYKLKQKMFDKLVSYRMYKIFQKDTIKFADNFYRKKLLMRSINSFWENLQRRLYKKERLYIFAERKCYRIKKYFFNCWRIYVINKKSKTQKHLMATRLFESRCKKKYFRKLKLYRLYRKVKKEYQTIKLQQIKYIFDRRIVTICLNNWKYFTYYEKVKKERLHLAQKNHEFLLKKTFFRSWLHFKKYKNLRKMKIIEMELLYYRKTLQRSFDCWRSFSHEKRMFMLKKKEAKKYYQHCLVRNTFRLMIKSAFQEKDYKLDNYLENEKRRLISAQKFIKIWKSKTIKNHGKRKLYWKEINLNSIEDKSYKFDQNRNILLHSFVGSLPENFIWDPICFARPRVPDYMKKYQNS